MSSLGREYTKPSHSPFLLEWNNDEKIGAAEEGKTPFGSAHIWGPLVCLVACFKAY